MVANVSQFSDSLTVSVHDALANYMAVGAFEPGSTLKIDELRYVIRGVPGILGVTTVNIEGHGVNLAMPNRWTIPFMSYLYLTQVDQYGNIQTSEVGFQPTVDVGEIVD